MPASNQIRPCWYCPVELQHMKSNGPTPYTNATYLAEVAKSNFNITVDRTGLQLIMAVLSMDKRSGSKCMHGRVVSTTLHVTDVAKGTNVLLHKFDRLENGGDLTDIHCTVHHFTGPGPWVLWFWRRCKETCLSFRSWVTRCYGFQFEFLMIGTLHILDLGVTPQVMGHVLIAILKEGTMYKNTASIQGMADGCRKMSASLRRWYKANKTPSRMSKLTPKKLGFVSLTSTGFLKAKGMEARLALGFVHSLLAPTVVHSLPRGPDLLSTTEALLDVYKIMAESPREIDSDRLEVLCQIVAISAARAGIHFLPKFHLMTHFAHLSRRAGNPRCFSEAADESHNRLVVAVAQAASTPWFAGKILAREELLSRLQKEEME